MASMRDIKRRKSSITSTQQITKAMKLVSTVKLQKARAHAEATDPYFNYMYRTVSSMLAKSGSIEHPYLKAGDSPRKAVVVLTSNRGLAGGYNSNFSKYSSILVGDVLSITKTEIVYLIVIFVVTIVFWVLCFNKLNAICIHRSVAKSKGIHVRLLDNLFAVLVALIVMLSIKWIGILIINALLILPAASSRNISENMREYHFFSVIFSVFSGIVGLAVSYYTNVATGPMIVIIASVIYFSTFIFGRKLKK
jgi:hypothetical protein